MELDCDIFRDNLIEFLKSNVNKLNPLQKHLLRYPKSKMQVREVDLKLFWTIWTKASLEAKLELMCSVSNEK